MGRETKQKRRPLPVLTAVGVAALGVGLLTRGDVVAEGVRRGLEVCGGVLIPSLFPFMVLSVFLSLTQYARILSAPLRPVTTGVFKLPAELGVVVLLSMIGGYPVGAKSIAGLLGQERIDRKTAERMLCFCVNSGPSFLISAVGMGLFHDKTAGGILFLTQTAATLLIGWLVSLRAPVPRGGRSPRPQPPGGAALVMAVQGATSGMLTMCAFAILFSGVLSMIRAGGLLPAMAAVLPVGESVLTAVVSGFLEVTSGCIAAAQVGGEAAFGLTSAIVSFSGLSVLFQVISCFGARPVRFRPLILCRLIHVCLSTAMALPLYRFFCGDLTAWRSVQEPLLQTDGKTTLISVCLLGMCTIFTLSLGDSFQGKRE